VKTWHLVVGLAVVGVAGVVVYKMTRPQLTSGDGTDPSLGNGDTPAPAPVQPAPQVVYVQPAPTPALAPIPAAQPAAAYSTSDPRAGGVDTADTSMNGWGGYESGGYH
jgi:hypothetical protein